MSDKTYTCVKYAEENRVARITMCAPEKLNALDGTMISELTDALGVAEKSENVKVIVLTGEGKAFCAGGDVTCFQTMNRDEAYDFMKESMPLVNAFKKTPKPIIAAVNGFAVGAGMSLSLLCDISVASDKAKFGAAFVKVGLVPDMGLLYTLPRAVGIQKAYELTVTGKNIDAQEALRIGLVANVVPHEELEETVNGLCELLKSHPAGAMGVAKALMNKGMSMDLGELLEEEALAQSALIVSEDSREGVNAFLNKRKPEFK